MFDEQKKIVTESLIKSNEIVLEFLNALKDKNDIIEQIQDGINSKRHHESFIAAICIQLIFFQFILYTIF